MLTVIESLDGGGKTTHIKRLAEELEGLGLRTVVVASPGKESFSGTVLRNKIGNITPDQANRLFAYDIERSQRRVPPNTDVILCDRHLDSVRVSNSEPSIADPQIARIARRITPPDKKIYLSIPPEVSWERESQTSTHPINFEWIHTKHRRYMQIIGQNPENFTIIDATQSLDVVYQAILQILLKDLDTLIEARKCIYDLFLSTPGLIKFILDEPVEVKPGVFLPMFVNVKTTMGDPIAREKITDDMLKLAKHRDYDSVLGLESGGSYYAVAIANKLGLPVAFHRTKLKTYSGVAGDIVGRPPQPGSRVLMVDDVYATGQSASRASKRLRDFGCQHDLVTAFSYSSDTEMIKRLGGIPATAVAYFKGIRTSAIKSGILSVDDAKRLTKLVDIYRTTIFE